MEDSYIKIGKRQARVEMLPSYDLIISTIAGADNM
jgi:hypothetical protein